MDLINFVRDMGGETAKYKLVPPGERNYPWMLAVAVPVPAKPAETKSVTATTPQPGMLV